MGHFRRTSSTSRILVGRSGLHGESLMGHPRVVARLEGHPLGLGRRTRDNIRS